MNKEYDFTNIYEKVEIIKTNIVQQLFLQRHELKNFSLLNLKDFEILFLWQTYIAVSSFCIKLKEACNIKKTKIKNNQNHVFELFNYTSDIMHKNYYDNEYNDSLINLLQIIIYSNEYPINSTVYKKSKINFENILINTLYKFRNKKLSNKKYIFENNRWLALTFDKNNAVLPYYHSISKVNLKIRSDISKIIKKIFSTNIKNLFMINDLISNEKISELFSEHYNSFLSLSLVEGFEKNRIYYTKIFNRRNIKYVHTCNGFLTSDYFKILSVAARNLGANLVTHEHGVYNFFPFIRKNNNKNIFYKIHSTLRISDYYLQWGISHLNNNTSLDIEKYFNVKIINSGSVYLDHINKKFPLKKNDKKNTILFLDSPFKKHNFFEFDGNYNDIFKRKSQICDLFKKLIKYNSNIKIIYKPFFHSYYKNPIIELGNYLPVKNFEINKSNSLSLMNYSDLIISDSLSTTFAESLSINKPMLIFGNKFEYLNASEEGKRINDNLSNNKIISYNIDEIYNEINQFLNNNEITQLTKSDNYIEFKKIMASPIADTEFLKKISNLI